jgi:hypothetical protein
VLLIGTTLVALNVDFWRIFFHQEFLVGYFYLFFELFLDVFGVVAIVGLLLLIYASDFAWYELRVAFPKLGVAKGSVHRLRILAIPQKSGKVEYVIDSQRPEEDLPCSHSLFPEPGGQPCWYVVPHATDPIPM